MITENQKERLQQALTKARLMADESSQFARLALHLQPVHPKVVEYITARASIAAIENVLKVLEINE